MKSKVITECACEASLCAHTAKAPSLRRWAEPPPHVHAPSAAVVEGTASPPPRHISLFQYSVGNCSCQVMHEILRPYSRSKEKFGPLTNVSLSPSPWRPLFSPCFY